MKLLNLNQEQWPEVKQIAKHLGRENELGASIYNGLDAAKCLRRKNTDRQYNIVNSDQGLLVVMDYDDLNFYPQPIVGKFYYCRLSNAKIGELNTTYLVKFNKITDESYLVEYQPMDFTLKHGTQQPVKMEWKKEEITITSFELADVEEFFKV